MNKKNILICTGIYPPDIGGPATYTKTLEKELPGHGFAVRVITYADKPEKFNSIIKIDRSEFILIKYVKYFRAVLNNFDWADVVYSQGPFASGLPVWLASKMKKKKYYLKVVGDYAWERGQQKAGVLDGIDDFQDLKYDTVTELVRNIEHKVARNAKQVIVPSQYLKGIVKKWGVKDDRIKIIYNSVKKASVPFGKEEARKKLNLDGFTLITGGRLTPWKGVGKVVDLLPELLKTQGDIKFLIVGSGPEEENLKKKVDDLNLNAKVIFTGKLAQMELWEYIAASDLFVLNTAYEGLPHILVEALYLGCPLAVSNVGGNPEVVKDGVNGLLYEYNNKEQIMASVQKFLNRDFYNKIKANLQVSLDKFDKEKMVERLVKELS